MISSAKLACGGAVALMLLGGMICPAMAETNTDSAYGRVEQRIIENNPDFDIQLKYGLNGYAVNDRGSVIRLDIVSDTDFAGNVSVQTSYSEGFGTKNMTYARDVELKAGDTIALFDELQQDEPGTFDVMFGGGIESFEECRDYFQPYTVSEAERIQEQYRAEEDVYTPFSVLPTVFIYNNKLVYPVAAPKTWAELQTDRWEGKIAFADPTKSGSSYTALCTMLQVLGEDEETILRNFCDTLDGNVSASSGEVLEEVNAGTRLVGITSEGMARQKILEGEDITVIYPQDGTSAIPDATAIVKGCRHPENAKAFLEFTVSTDVQRLVEEKFFRRTVRNDMDEYAIQEKNKLKAIDYDIQWAAREKENILTAWERLQEENR